MKGIVATTIILILQCAAAEAQDLSGFWKGTFRMQGCFTSNNIELQLNLKDGMATGDSYHYQDVNNYVKKTFTGRFDASQKKLRVEEGMVTTFHIPYHCVVCIKQFTLVYSRSGNVETLRGLWTGNIMNSHAACGTDSIILTRIKESAFKDIPEIKVDTGLIRLDFYDNAEIDGDSITVRVNNKVVLTHQRLTATALTTFVHVDESQPFHEVEMIAENLGTIPPNTAVLVITAGEKLHRLSISSAEEKIAKVRIVYEAGAGKKPDPPKYSTR